MHLSLLSRFQGFLFGAGLGEACGMDRLRANRTGSYGYQGGPVKPQISALSLPLCRSLETRIEVLIQSQLARKSNSNFRPKGALERKAETISDRPATNGQWAMAIAGILPLTLFFHENPVQLHQQVHLSLAQSNTPELEPEALAIAQMVSSVCREQLPSLDLISKSLDQLGYPTTAIANRLGQIQDLLTTRASLATAMKVLALSQSSDYSEIAAAIALAVYCWLSTPEFFPLSLLRSQQLSNISVLIPMLTGALSGAHNGLVGIPTGWQLHDRESSDQFDDHPPLYSKTRSHDLAAQLLAVWSGYYQPLPTNAALERLEQEAIAAPDVIRPRIFPSFSSTAED